MQGRAIDYARGKGYRFVTCGHTHLPLTAEVDGVRYFNTGTWIEPPPCPFLAVIGDDVRLETFPPEGYNPPRKADEEAEAPQVSSLRE